MLGSVADRVIRHGTRPVLLVRVPAREPHPGDRRPLAESRVRDIMVTNVVAAGPETTLAEAARIMLMARIGALPVTGPDGTLQGIVSESDFIPKQRGFPFSAVTAPQLFREWLSAGSLARIYAEGRGKAVADVMTRDVVTAMEDQTVEDVMLLMLKHDKIRIPVVRGGRLVGIVARHDVLRLMTGEPTQADAAR